MEFFDALIIGGGPAGATAAMLLARWGWSVAVVERKEFPRRKVCGEYLSATNWPLFEKLGLRESLDAIAGPEVREVGLIVGGRLIRAQLPGGQQGAWGRAIEREQLDTLLLRQAAEAGAQVLQPWTVTDVVHTADDVRVHAVSKHTAQSIELSAPIVVAAHGSWDAGSLPTQPARLPARPRDLFGFKAHFHTSGLAAGLMPLVSFPHGYGGLVHTGASRTSFSCCIQRQRLARLDRACRRPAGEAVLDWILSTTPALCEIVSQAACDGPWLSAGPIRPGMRARYRDRVFLIGNAAGEAHPVVAEGISMAMQSAWLLASAVGPWRDALNQPALRERIGRRYARAYRQNFAGRIRAAAAVAHWAMRPSAVKTTLPLVWTYPTLLTWGARLSGKASLVVDV